VAAMRLQPAKGSNRFVPDVVGTLLSSADPVTRLVRS
jgi:hypothetical protein